MKRSAIVLCVLAALSVGCVAAAHGMLMGTADKVEFRSAALFGDIASADGLTLTARQTCGRQLYWDSSLPVAAPERAETAFAALPLAQPRQDDPSLHGLTLYTSIGTGSYDFGGGAEPSGLRAMLAGPGRAVPDRPSRRGAARGGPPRRARRRRFRRGRRRRAPASPRAARGPSPRPSRERRGGTR